MRLRDAVRLIEGSRLAALGPTVWADLGCGDGTFTHALAHVIAPGSVIHAMDRDADALTHVTPQHNVRIATYLGDFIQGPWPFANLDGVLMANSLHYVEDQPAFIASCRSHMQPDHRFLIIEYDTDRANPWVPYPVGRAALARLCAAAGYPPIAMLGSRPSAYRRAEIYASLVESVARPRP